MRNPLAAALSLALVVACSSDEGQPPSGDRTGGTAGSGTSVASSGNTTSTSNATTGSNGGSGGAAGASSSTGVTGGSGGEGGSVGGSSGASGSSGAGGKAGGGAGGRDGGSAGSGVGGSGGAPPPRDGGPPTGFPARDVQLTLVEANQSSAVALLKMGALVSVAMRNAELIEGRPTLVRAHFDVGTGWMARSILGVLTLTYGDGTKLPITQTKNVTADSNPDQLASTFNFLLTAAEVKPGMSMSVELQETAQPGTPEPAQPPRFPADGTATDLGIKAGPMVLKVVIVPATTPGGVPQSTDERRKKLYDHLFDLYPVQNVEITWHDPIDVPNPTDRTAVFNALRATCMAENPPAAVVYHLVIRGADSNFTFAGTSNGSPSGPTQRCRALSLTVANGATAYIDGNVNTTAHELGHNHGRRHIPCGGADGADTSYPYQPPDFPEGWMGAQGYSISENALKPLSMFKELMGYCRPRWVSDWQWNAFAARVRTTTSWPTTIAALESGRTLSGFVDSAGNSHWAVIPGHLAEPGDKAFSSRNARIFQSGGSTMTVPISVFPFSEPGLVEVVANLPDGPLPDKVTVTVQGKQHLVDLRTTPRY